MDCSPPGSSVHEIFQARIQEWVAISFSRGSSQPRDQTWVSCTAGRFFTDWATREELFLEKAKLVPATLDFMRVKMPPPHCSAVSFFCLPGIASPHFPHNPLATWPHLSTLGPALFLPAILSSLPFKVEFNTTSFLVLSLTYLGRVHYFWCDGPMVDHSTNSFIVIIILWLHIYMCVCVYQFSSVQLLSHVWLCDSVDYSTPGFPAHHQLPELAPTHVHQVSDTIQPSHHLSSPSPPAFNPSQNQGIFQWVSSLHDVAKVLELQLQHQSFQWTLRTDFL